MKCPYCAEEIKNDAIACRYCHRDFFVIQPLMAKLKAASARISELEARLADAGFSPDSNDLTPQRTTTAKTAAIVTKIDDRIPALPPWAVAVFTFAALVLAHFFIIVQFDLSLVFLRVVSIVVPLIFGFLYRNAMDRWLWADLLTGIAIAIVSILAMSVVVSKVDRVPILPQDMQGWREYAEYAASIGFGFFAGCTIRHGLMIARSPSAKVSFAIELVSRYIARRLAKKGDDDADGEKPVDAVEKTLKKIETLVSGAIAVGSVMVSIYTGFSGLFK